MRMGRLELGAAVLVSVVIVMIGIGLGLSRAGTDAAAFGWLLAFIGALALATAGVVAARGLQVGTAAPTLEDAVEPAPAGNEVVPWRS